MLHQEWRLPHPYKLIPGVIESFKGRSQTPYPNEFSEHLSMKSYKTRRLFIISGIFSFQLILQ